MCIVALRDAGAVDDDGGGGGGGDGSYGAFLR